MSALAPVGERTDMRYDNGLWRLGRDLSPLFADVGPVDIDTELYGPLEAES